MDNEGIFVLSQEEIEFLEFMAEVSRAAAALPVPDILILDTILTDLQKHCPLMELTSISFRRNQ